MFYITKEYETRLVDLAPKEIQKEEHLIIKTFSFVIVTGNKYCYFNMEETQTKRGSNEPLLPILGQ